MADVETKMTLKLDEHELKALQKLLYFQYHNSHDTGLNHEEKDLVNGIFFAINDSFER